MLNALNKLCFRGQNAKPSSYRADISRFVNLCNTAKLDLKLLGQEFLSWPNRKSLGPQTAL